jgi:hypothetical protein
LGLILCSERNREQIELLQLNEGEIRVAEYLTAQPEKKLLASKLHEAVAQCHLLFPSRFKVPLFG